tara:strand:+ start:1072 stop:1221 length:150 start_codon:yes stop_codon:yes gene_type:complete
MTKKHFIALSGVINTTIRYFIDALVVVFSKENPRFDAEKFKSACFKDLS